MLYASIPGGPRDITTLLCYRPAPVDAGAPARAILSLDRLGIEFGEINPLCSNYRPPVGVPAMMLLPEGSRRTVHGDNAATALGPALVAQNWNEKHVAAEPLARRALRNDCDRLCANETRLRGDVREKEKRGV